MNEGWRYAHEYESYSNIQRRLFISNPVYCNTTPSTVRRIINRHISDFSQPTIWAYTRNEYRYLPFQENHDNIHQVLIPRRFGWESKAIKQCPECAKIVFHSDVYNFQWMTHCPFHKKELVIACPVCHKQWPDYSPYSYKKDIDNSCPCCGITNINNSEALSIENKLALSEAIKPAFDVVDCYLSNTIGYVTDDYEDIRLDMTPLGGKNTPIMLSHLGISGIPNVYCNSDISVNKVEFVSSSLERKNSSDLVSTRIRYPLCLDKTLEATLENVTQELVSEIHNVTGQAHQLRDMSLPWSFSHCPYCLAFGLWYHHWHYGKPIDLYGYLCLQEPTLPTYLATTDARRIKLPIDVQSILFKNQLNYSFFVLFRYVCAFLTSLQKSTNRTLFWIWQSEEIRNLPDKSYRDFLFFKTKSDMITFLYITQSFCFLSEHVNFFPSCDPIYGDRNLYKDTNNGYYLNEMQKEFYSDKNQRHVDGKLA